MIGFSVEENDSDKTISVSTIQQGWKNEFLLCTDKAVDFFFETLDHNTRIISTGLLPSGVRHLSTDRRTIVWEVPPQRKLYNFIPYTIAQMRGMSQEEKDAATKTYSLPIPWSIFLIKLDSNYNFSEAYMYFTGLGRSIYTGSLNIAVTTSPLHNVYSDGRICFSPETLVHLKERENFPTIRDLIAGVYEAYWNSVFNVDTAESFNNFNARSNANFRNLMTYKLALDSSEIGKPVDFYKRWEKLSLSTVVDIPWGDIGIGHLNLNHKIIELDVKDEGYLNSIIFHQITTAMKEANTKAAS